MTDDQSQSQSQSQTHSFQRSHSVDIDAAPAVVLDYVSNPNSWPRWLAASHELDSPDRPLVTGDVFREEWRTRTGPAVLRWRVTDHRPAEMWIGETGADFLGPIIVRYDVARVGGLTRFTRTVTNPARPRPISDAQIAGVDAEAEIALANIKRNIETGAMETTPLPPPPPGAG
ncbi:MAG: cyclase [Rhodobacteraceae bacterium]|nr:cyclase [Paracoccaceae bacterium]MBR28019.1 cyclase [Paracoccaceae bacterium]